MSKSKFKLKNKSVVASANPFEKPRFQQISMPEIPRKERIRIGLKAGEEAKRDFPIDLQRLHAAVLESSPLSLLCSIANEGLFSTDGLSKEFEKAGSVLQPHIELIQSLILKHKFDEYKMNPVDPNPIVELSQKVSAQFPLIRLEQLISSGTDEDRAKNRLKEFARVSAQGVRNWGYPQHIRAILHNLLAPLDANVEARHGIKISTCVDLLFMIVRLTEARATDFINYRLAFARKKEKREMFNEYKKLFDFDPSLNLTEKLVADQSVSLNQLLVHLWATSEQFLFVVFGISVDDLQELCGGDKPSKETISKLLKMWSLGFGDITEPDEYLLMGSPIRAKPIVSLPEEHYLLPIPGLLISFANEMLEQLFDTDELKQKYKDRRADFLEEELAILVAEMFPGGNVYTGSQWRADEQGPSCTLGTLYENDVLLVIDEFAIVFEAKSRRIAESSRRGGDRLIDKEIAELMVAPAIQAANFTDFLARHKGQLRLQTKRGIVNENEIDTSAVRYFIPISVTLDDLPLREGWEELKEAGAVDKEVPHVPTYNLADLYIVFDILADVGQRLHYILKRSQLPKTFKFVGDEVDLLSVYLKTQFHLEIPKDSEYIGLGEARVFNKYYLQTYEGIDATKPTLPLTQRWEAMLKHAPTTGPGWTNISNTLLNCSSRQQSEVETRIRKIGRGIRRSGQSEQVLVLKNGFPEPPEALAIVIHNEMSPEDLRTKVDNGVKNAFNEHEDVDIALGITVEAKRPDIPFRYMVWLHSQDDSTKVCIPG